MTAPKEAPQPLPPYVPYRTFLNFIASLKQGMPGRIDRTLMGNLSGAMQSQLFGALRYLNLIDEHDRPRDTFKRLVATEGAEQQEVLRGILKAVYTILFEADGFSLANATEGQFAEQFRKAGASGDTIRKCETFFLMAAKDADIPISPRITKATHTRNGPSKPRARTESQTGRSRNGATVGNDRPAQQPLIAPDPQSGDHTTRTVTLRGGETLTLSVNGNPFRLDRKDRAFVFGLIDSLDEYEETANKAEGETRP